MTFPEVLKLMLKDSKATFSSRKARAVNQNLESIKYWLYEYKVEEHRCIYYTQFMKAKDWKKDDGNW
jgi:hypothetical protein